jgi:hypothetical protein
VIDLGFGEFASTTRGIVAELCCKSKGTDPVIIGKVLGHSQFSTTRRYTHVPIEVTKSALEGLESLFQAAKNGGEGVPVTV